MRVIAGVSRGTKLTTLEGQDTTRPTIDRVKEGMFSSVQFILPGAKVLDLFAGSGQLGIEALSRGAATCVFIDENEEAHAVIQQNLKAAGLFSAARVAKQEAFTYLSACKEKFDVILLDPPYRHDFVQKALPLLAAVTAPGGVVLAETEAGLEMPETAGVLRLAKQYKYGTVCVWRYVANEE